MRLKEFQVWNKTQAQKQPETNNLYFVYSILRNLPKFFPIIPHVDVGKTLENSRNIL